MKLSGKTILLLGAAAAVGIYLWKRQAGAAGAVPKPSGAGSVGSRVRFAGGAGANSSAGIP